MRQAARRPSALRRALASFLAFSLSQSAPLLASRRDDGLTGYQPQPQPRYSEFQPNTPKRFEPSPSQKADPWINYQNEALKIRFEAAPASSAKPLTSTPKYAYAVPTFPRQTRPW
jgi:hypothetical protein